MSLELIIDTNKVRTMVETETVITGAGQTAQVRFVISADHVEPWGVRKHEGLLPGSTGTADAMDIIIPAPLT